MLSIIVQWCYLFFMAYSLGFVFSEICERLIDYKIKNAASCLLSGLIILTVYSQVFSLFYKVGLAANIVILIFVLGYIIWHNKQFRSYIEWQWKNSSNISKIIFVILFVVWAYCTSRGYMVYDTSLYHGQSIRWLEDYGVVKGLGNLHERFAYNSSVFSLYALFSMKYITGGIPMHTVNGFFALVLSLSVLKLGYAWKRKKLNLSDYARVAAIYYLTTICDEIVAPSSDYPVMCMLFFTIITWLDLLEQDDKENFNIAPYCLLCVLGVYTLTLKLTAGLILLLLAKPVVFLLKNKKWKDIAIYLVMGLIVAIPWMARSVIISGYLIYPLQAVDLFNVDWKIPDEILQADVANIKTWGRALYNMYAVNVPIYEWFPNWFNTTLLSTEKLLILACILAFVIVIVAAIVILIKKKWEHLDILLVLVTVACSYLYWQNSAPLMRYGYAYVLLLVALTAGWIISFFTAKVFDRIIRIAIILLGIYKMIWFVQYSWSCAALPYYIWQQDYEVFELQENNVDGQIIYTPVYNDRTGYYSFPSVPHVNGLKLRGEDFKDGFHR